MNSPVHVVCASNRGYIMPLSVMLVSLVDNFDPQRELVIHVISNDATEDDHEKVRASLKMIRPGLSRVDIQWYAFDSKLLSGLQLLSYFTVDTYSRLLAPLILPAGVEKAIYLDCDLVVLRDISALYDSATGDAMIHAAQDIATPFVSSNLGVFDYKERAIPADTAYFNAGVMVVNFKKWRERNVTQATLDYLAQSGRKMHCQDQGALNGLLYNDRVLMDPRWNEGFDIVFYQLWKVAGYTREEWSRLRKDPYIIHYSGEKKPWQKGRRGPRYSYFYQYLEKTVFKGSIPHRPYLETIIGVAAYFQLWRAARTVPDVIRSLRFT